VGHALDGERAEAPDFWAQFETLRATISGDPWTSMRGPLQVDHGTRRVGQPASASRTITIVRTFELHR
jgi:hypothetical protein